MKLKKVGLTLGKFAPLHKGHQYLFETALSEINHLIIVNQDVPAQDFKDLIVPKDKYFMMGDNRDDSDDSRGWGFAPIQNFIGQAHFVWFNVTFFPFHVDLNRIGNTFRL